MFTNFDDADFLEFTKLRLMTTSAACVLNLSHTAVTESLLERSVKKPVFTPWNGSKDVRAQFEKNYHCQVKNCGIFVHPDYKFLASKPDDLVEKYSATFRYADNLTRRDVNDIAYLEFGLYVHFTWDGVQSQRGLAIINMTILMTISTG
jgi:hypothetical protein